MRTMFMLRRLCADLAAGKYLHRSRL
jgi:hypothetical protein